MPDHVDITPVWLLAACLVWLFTIVVAAAIGWWVRGDHTRVRPGRYVWIVDLIDETRSRDHPRPRPGPRAFTPGRYPVAHLRDPLDAPTQVMPRRPERTPDGS